MAAATVVFPSLAQGVEAATTIVRSGVAIARCEFLDAICIKNVNARDGLSLSEAPTLLFEFHGSKEGVAEDAQIVGEIVSDFGGSEFSWSTEEGARRKLWQARHNAYWASLVAHPGQRIVTTDTAVPLSRLAEAVAVAEEIFGASRFPYSILGHVADGNFHCFVMLDPNDPQQLDEVRALTHQLTDRILTMGGTCTGEHGIGLGKIDDLLNETGKASVEVMRSFKATLDPNNILNPGKIFHK